MQFSKTQTMRRINGVLAAGYGLWMAGVGGVAGGQTPTVLEDHQIVASDGEAADWFGYSVSISGTVTIVGARQNSTAGGTVAGSAYVYRFDGTTWVEEAQLFASDGTNFDVFGESVAIGGTPGSEVAIVGAPGDDSGAGNNVGSAYVFRFNGTTWVEEAHIFASDGAVGDNFGNSVSISGSSGSEIAIVGARTDNVGSQSNAGSAYVYRFNGTTWVEEAHLVASNATANDTFGFSVSINSNAGSEIAIVGAPHDDEGTWPDSPAFDRGSVYVYRYNGTSWVQEANLLASDAAAHDWFGTTVSISGAPGSEVFIVGSYKDDTGGGLDAGSAYVFRFNGTTWGEEGHLIASDGAAGDWFGHSVSISSTPGSEVAIVGVRFDNLTGGVNFAGSAYVYRFDGTSWVEESYLLSSDTVAGQFGYSVSVSEEVFIAAAPFDLEAGVSVGSVYVFGNPVVACTADLTPPGGNGTVNIDDLVAVLNAFGGCPVPPAPCGADIAPAGGNGVVNIDDLVAVLNAFGGCP